MKVVAIDASNIRAGGGLTHLRELLAAADPKKHGIEKVIVWGGEGTLSGLLERDWLVRKHEPLLDKGPLHRQYWRKVKLSEYAKDSCDLLFVPGGTYSGKYQPFVAMSQNLLPFDKVERDRFKYSLTWCRYILLNYLQKRTFNAAAGVIFLTETARRVVSKHLNKCSRKVKIVPHGINEAFRKPPTVIQSGSKDLGKTVPFKWLYVSIINLYKHQWNVIRATEILRNKGFNIELDLVGPNTKFAKGPFNEAMSDVGSNADWLRYHGNIPYAQLSEFYHQADGFVFASSCENLPNILLEAMAAGLPIACSDRGPMPEVLANAGAYFDPENVASIADAMEQLLTDKAAREGLANQAYEKSLDYSWSRCADETFSFLADVMKGT